VAFKTGQDLQSEQIQKISEIESYPDINGLNEEQNTNLKFFFNDLSLNKDIGTWHDFAKNLSNVENARAYTDSLYHNNIISVDKFNGKPVLDYLAENYTPILKNQQHSDAVNVQLPKDIDRSQITTGKEFSDAITEVYSDDLEVTTKITDYKTKEEINVGLLQLNDDGSWTEIRDDKQFLSEVAFFLNTPNKIATLMHLLDYDQPFDMNNYGIVNYNQIISGQTVGAEFATKMVFDEGRGLWVGSEFEGIPSSQKFDEGELENEPISNSSIELKILRHLQKDGYDFEHFLLNWQDEEVVSEFIKKVADAHYDIELQNIRTDLKSKDVDLKGMNDELSKVYFDVLWDVPPEYREQLERFIADKLLMHQPGDDMLEYGFFAGVGAEGADEFGLTRGFYQDSMHNPLNPTHFLNRETTDGKRYGDIPAYDSDGNYNPNVDQFMWNYLLSIDENLRENLEAIYAKYVNNPTGNWYENKKYQLRNSSQDYAGEYYSEFYKYKVKDLYTQERYRLVNADSGEIIKIDESQSDLITRYMQVADFANAKNQYADITAELNRMSLDERQRDILKAGLSEMFSGFSASFTEWIERENDTLSASQSVEEAYEYMRLRYPEFDRFASVNGTKYSQSIRNGFKGARLVADLAGFMTFGKVLSPTKTLVGNAFKLSLNTQRAIISGGQFTAYNMTHMTFDPNIPVGYYFKNDGPGIERNEGWHDSGGDYAKKIAIPAFTSFILGSQFPRLGTLGGEVVTIEKGSEAVAKFLVQSGALTTAVSVDQFINQANLVYFSQYDDDYKGEEITVQMALEQSIQDLFYGGNWDNNEFDPETLWHNLAFMSLFHSMGALPRLNFKKDPRAEKYLKSVELNKREIKLNEIVKEKNAERAAMKPPKPPLTNKEIEEIRASLPVKPISNHEARSNYVFIRNSERLAQWAEEIIKQGGVPKHIVKGYKGSMFENQQIHTWWVKEYQKPKNLLSLFEKSLQEFQGKKIYLPVTLPNGNLELRLFDFGTKESLTRLNNYKEFYVKLYNRYRNDPSVVNEKAMQKAIDSLNESLSLNTYMIGDLNVLSVKHNKVNVVIVKNSDGQYIEINPLTGTKRALKENEIFTYKKVEGSDNLYTRTERIKDISLPITTGGEMGIKQEIPFKVPSLQESK
jgi:hypothetical protein